MRRYKLKKIFFLWREQKINIQSIENNLTYFFCLTRFWLANQLSIDSFSPIVSHCLILTFVLSQNVSE